MKLILFTSIATTWFIALAIAAEVYANDLSCTTDIDCECKQVPYEESNDSDVCVEYRKQVEAEQLLAKGGAK